LRSVQFFDHQVLVPEHAETELEITYGNDWRDPKAAYRHNRRQENLDVLARFISSIKKDHANLSAEIPVIKSKVLDISSFIKGIGQ
jgi:hypothetical protein